MNVTEIANDFTRLCKSGAFEEAGQKYWADDVVSVEAMDGPMAVVKGKKEAKGKGDWWVANHEVHSFKTGGPYVNGDQFVVRFTIDVTPKSTGKRVSMDEVGLYTVKNSKIVEERFFYGTDEAGKG